MTGDEAVCGFLGGWGSLVRRECHTKTNQIFCGNTGLNLSNGSLLELFWDGLLLQELVSGRRLIKEEFLLYHITDG